MRFIRKEDREKVEIINKNMGTTHRTMPYNFKEPKDIIEAVSMATGEFMDMHYYATCLYNIEESFDESIEHFYPDTWINSMLPDVEVDDDVMEACEALVYAGSAFEILKDRAELKCRNLWEFVLLTAPDEVRLHFFDDNIVLDNMTANTALEEIFGSVYDVVYDSSISVATANFANHLKNILKSL